LLWGNDYPHHDSIWPNSMEVLDRIMTGVSEQDKNQMVWENVKNLYNINPDKLDI